MIMKGGQSVARAVSKFLSPIETVTVNSLNDIAPILGAFVPNNKVSDEMRGLILNPRYMKYMNAVPTQFMGNTFPDIQDYTNESSQNWAKAVLLDTLGIQPGTIFLEQEINGKVFLKAEQPNGLDVYYDPEELVAFAHQVRQPYEHTCLEKPIKELFENLPQDHEFIGVRRNGNGKLEKITFASLDDIPDNLIKPRTSSIQNLKNKGLDLESLGPHEELNISSVSPPSIAKKIDKPVLKELKIELKQTFKDKIIFNHLRTSQNLVDERIRNEYQKKDVVSSYFERLANPGIDGNHIHCMAQDNVEKFQCGFNI